MTCLVSVSLASLQFSNNASATALVYQIIFMFSERPQISTPADGDRSHFLSSPGTSPKKLYEIPTDVSSNEHEVGPASSQPAEEVRTAGPLNNGIQADGNLDTFEKNMIIHIFVNVKLQKKY